MTIISAPTGSGKSIGIPKLLLDIDLVNNPESAATPSMNFNRIMCTQPRRVAAVNLATHVATMSNFTLGDQVGYCIGGASEFKRGRTQLLFCTNAIAMNMLLQDSTPYNIILIDEVHVRSVFDDVNMAIMKHHYLKKNPNIRLVLMSAASDTQNLKNHFSKGSITTAVL